LKRRRRVRDIRLEEGGYRNDFDAADKPGEKDFGVPDGDRVGAGVDLRYVGGFVVSEMR